MSSSAVRTRQMGTCRAKIRQLWCILLFFCIPVTSFFLMFAHSYLLVPVRLNAASSDPAHGGSSARWQTTSFLSFMSKQQDAEDARAGGALFTEEVFAAGVVVAAVHDRRVVKRAARRERSVETKDRGTHNNVAAPRHRQAVGALLKDERRNHTGSSNGTQPVQFLRNERFPGQDSPRSSVFARPYPEGHTQSRLQGRSLPGQPLPLQSDREAPYLRNASLEKPDVDKRVVFSGTDDAKRVHVTATDHAKIASIESINNATSALVNKTDDTPNASVKKTEDVQNTPANKRNDAQNAPVEETDDTENAPVRRPDDAQNSPVERTVDIQNTPVQRTDDAQNNPEKKTDDTQNVPVQRADHSQNVPVQRTDHSQNVPVQRTDDAQTAPDQRTDDARNASITGDNQNIPLHQQSSGANKTSLSNKPDADRTEDANGSHRPRIETNPKLSDPYSRYPPAARLLAVLPSGGPGGRGNNSQRVDWILKNLQDVPPDEYLSPHEEFFAASSRNSHSGTLGDVPGTVMDCGRRCCPESDAPFLLIIIPSVADHVGERNTIRNTWASPLYNKHPWPRRHTAVAGGGAEGTGERRGGEDPVLERLVRVVFFLGVKKGRKYNPEKLKQELDKFGDIVLADFTDSYRNLSLKMVTALNWTATHCPQAGHMMKVDEDTFVELALAVDVLRALPSRRPPCTRYVLGHQHHSHKPPVVRRGKWEVDRRVYPFQAFPRYLVGHSYLISGDAVRDLAWVARWMPLVPNEDALLTGILAKAAGVRRIHCPSFAHTKPRQDSCELVDGRSISQTGFKPARRLLDMWLKVQQGAAGNCSATVV